MDQHGPDEKMASTSPASGGGGGAGGGKGFIGIHIGAGKYNEKKLGPLKNILNIACAEAMKLLRSGGTAMKAASLAVSILEDSRMCNAGRGSSLNWRGDVECDAGIMDGKTGEFGAVGAVQQVCNPINLAYRLCRNQSNLNHGLLRPCILVGPGALALARALEERVVDSGADMVSLSAKKKHERIKMRALAMREAQHGTAAKTQRPNGLTTESVFESNGNVPPATRQPNRFDAYLQTKTGVGGDPTIIHEGAFDVAKCAVVITSPEVGADRTSSDLGTSCKDNDRDQSSANEPLSLLQRDVAKRLEVQSFEEALSENKEKTDKPESTFIDQVVFNTNESSLEANGKASTLATASSVDEKPIEPSNENPSQIKTDSEKPFVFAIPQPISKRNSMSLNYNCDACSSKSTEPKTSAYKPTQGSENVRKRSADKFVDKEEIKKQRICTNLDEVRETYADDIDKLLEKVQVHWQGLVDTFKTESCMTELDEYLSKKETNKEGLRMKTEQLKKQRDNIIKLLEEIVKKQIDNLYSGRRHIVHYFKQYDRNLISHVMKKTKPLTEQLDVLRAEIIAKSETVPNMNDDPIFTTNDSSLQDDGKCSKLATASSVNDKTIETSNENPVTISSQTNTDSEETFVFAIPQPISKRSVLGRKSICDAISSESTATKTRHGSRSVPMRHQTVRKRSSDNSQGDHENKTQRKATVNHTRELKSKILTKSEISGASDNDKELLDGSIDKELLDGSNDKELLDGSNDKELLDGSNVKELLDGSNVIELLDGSNDKELLDGSNDKELLDGSNDKELLDGSNEKELLDGSNEKEEMLLDTVGAVCVDLKGNVAACCSSGGIILKPAGRLGQACIRGAGCWAQNPDPVTLKYGQAVSTSGHGEYLIRTSLAQEVARAFRRQSLDSPDREVEVGELNSPLLERTIREEFVESPFLRDVTTEKLFGVIVLLTSPQDSKPEEFLWAHNSPSFGVGFMSTEDSQPHVRLSKMPDDKSGRSSQDEKVNVESVRC